MEQSNPSRQTLESYYKQGNVFERNEGYYSQMLNSPRGTTRQGSFRQSSLLNSRNNIAFIGSPLNRQAESRVGLVNQNISRYESQQTNMNPSFVEALQENQYLAQHYARNGQQDAVIKEQQQKILKLEQIIRTNDSQISTYQKCNEELRLRMQNIKSIDREIYKKLQGSTSRNRQLLDMAILALKREKKREQIAKILQQIISH